MADGLLDGRDFPLIILCLRRWEEKGVWGKWARNGIWQRGV